MSGRTDASTRHLADDDNYRPLAGGEKAAKQETTRFSPGRSSLWAAWRPVARTRIGRTTWTCILDGMVTRREFLKGSAVAALGDLIRIGVEEADPLLGRGVDLRQAGEQMGEAVGESEILAVAGGVLADQVDLADALLEEAGGLGDYGFEAPAAESAAILRNHAEGARVIAAFGDLHVGEMVRGGEHSRGEVVIKVGLQRIGVGLQPLANGDDTFQLVGADEGIHFG